VARVAPITEQFQHFVEDLKDSFWGDLCGKTRLAWKKFWEAESERARDSYLKLASHERCEPTYASIIAMDTMCGTW